MWARGVDAGLCGIVGKAPRSCGWRELGGFYPPGPCSGSLVVFTHGDGPKRVAVVPRRGEFTEILCPVCHGAGVFSVSWLEYENPAAGAAVPRVNLRKFRFIE